MKKLLKIFFLLLLATAISFQLQAQKFGHLNTGNLLIQIPSTKTADEQLQALQDSLVTAGEAHAKAAQAEYVAFAKEYQAGNVPPAEAQKKQAEFEKKEQELAQLEDEIAAKLAKKRQELLGPILEQLEKAVNEVGKEGGYTMIFDTSVFNSILFAKDSDDIEPFVKAKMGIK
ncbi:MAG: OmpH family outer membrane protein [Saprospiraceae bacterium]|nr:OmpH family outer membrane protein [Saprospiraceae bacterium]MCF8251865.1 OmpH family outer membrane protein [Saprospiraceae bacterium]MCF8283078.1 OmpH family outer membrane protein [Bacteroidales bacterium]MCF8313542.1 OmpH family outer membrane protein [Saprospiraceae bacterium]MCF8442613.1 OmpH family outer membrane protein [Saprospiraceae bacterium]